MSRSLLFICDAYPHPYPHRRYVNFDADVFQLIREAKCLERMNLHMPLPEAARVLVLQEARFKRQYGQFKCVRGLGRTCVQEALRAVVQSYALGEV